MNQNISFREESQPFKDLFTSLINQNSQLTNEVKQIKTQINDQYEHLIQQTKDSQLKIDRLEQELNQQIQNNKNLNREFNLFEQNLNQQIKEGRIVPYILICLFMVFVISEIDQLKQSLNEQIQINQNLTNKLNLVEGNLNQQESAIQAKQHLQLIEHRVNYLIRTRSYLKWKPNAQTMAGGNGQGDKLNQLSAPNGIYVNHQQQHIYIADFFNHRVVKWKLGENNGQIVGGGNGLGSRINQLNQPSDVIVDENNKSLIICDRDNRRVVRWSLENTNGDKEILIENIQCCRLMMNENGDLFVCDRENHVVKRWRKSEIGKGGEGTIVAGGNGQGNKLNQLNSPTYIFIDREEAIYVSDWKNHRVMKWLKGASEGIIVAGGQGQGNSLNQLNHPQGFVVNEVGDIYVADWGNNRIMCWSLGSKEGRVVVSGNGRREGLNQLNYPKSLSFDVENNLYVVDYGNHRIQRFLVDKN